VFEIYAAPVHASDEYFRAVHLAIYSGAGGAAWFFRAASRRRRRSASSG
jgi:hypothetical protein